jgi:class 3 adenylate cyclase/pimeloyl-ACP methyl ester carboxylesterase
VAAAAPIRYARSDGLDIAYQVMGDGPIDIVGMIGWVSHLEVLVELPEAAHFIDRLAAIGRLVIFDKRGTGMSDRPTKAATFDQMVPDVLSVMNAVGMEQAALLGWVDAAALAMTVAARHPERVTALILGEAIATATPDASHPWGPDPATIKALADAIEGGLWGQAVLLPFVAPSVAGDERILGWFRRLERMSATPNMAANLMRLNLGVDLRPLLPRIAAPALLLHRRDSPLVPGEGIKWLADHLPDGHYVEVPGDEGPGYLGDVDALMDEIEDFLVGTRSGAASNRRVTTVLFSDIVSSTQLAADLGDSRWHHLLETHRVGMRRLLARHGGTEVDTAGDGFLITFDSPTNAIRCALAMSTASRADGLTVRIGIHTGEVVQQGADISGMAVHIGARVTALASGDEVLASGTVRDMVIGSGFTFTARGRHQLKGVPGDWELFSVDL